MNEEQNGAPGMAARRGGAEVFDYFSQQMVRSGAAVLFKEPCLMYLLISYLC